MLNANFTTKYRSGKRNIDADFLSRIPADEFQNTIKEDSVIISPGDISLIFKNAEQETDNWNIKI